MLTSTNRKWTPPARRGVILVIAALLLVVIFAFVAFSVDVGYMAMTKSQLQNAADASAMAGSYKIGGTPETIRLAAKEVAYANTAAAAPVVVPDSDIELGVFDYSTKVFTTNEASPNAVRVTTRVEDQKLFFAPVLKRYDFDMEASAIAMLNPRDIVFVVDLSGSMNDDTEPCWATETINTAFASQGYPNVADPLMQAVFADFGFGSYPGTSQYFGEPLGVSQTETAFAEMTQDDGPLSNPALDDRYRILPSDEELTRREKAYRWIIDYQIAPLMPNARPVPNSTTTYAYWEKYIDYLMYGTYVGDAPPPPPPSEDPTGGGGTEPPTPPPPPPPAPPLGWQRGGSQEQLWSQLSPHRPPVSRGLIAGDNWSAAQLLLMQSPTQMRVGVPRRGSYDQIWVPWYVDGDAIYSFNNPNYFTFPGSSWTLPYAWRNRVGYITYVQFMMDFGRDRSPDVDNWSGNAQAGVGTKTPLSVLSNHCPRHTESVAGRSFNFPPREQPMHAVRNVRVRRPAGHQ